MRDSIKISIVIPVHNEGNSIQECLDSAINDELNKEIFVSNNCSTDSTHDVLNKYAQKITVRNLSKLQGPTEHFISTGRWALENSDANFFCFLAGDDFVDSHLLSGSVDVLIDHPESSMVFPNVRWLSADKTIRLIKSPNFNSRFSLYRQLKAYSLPNTREVAGQFYGLFRRSDFEDLLNTMQRVGERFGSDYITIVLMLKRHRSIAAHNLFIHRRVREGRDLLTSIGYVYPTTRNPVLLGSSYLRLHFTINQLLSVALSRATNLPPLACAISTHVIRFPQILIEIPMNIGQRKNRKL